MGILHGRDLFSPKYITAEIKDASKRLWYVPIKHTIGEYFLADIGGQIYCFKIDNEICQYREKLTKSFRVIQYDTKHYRPIKSEIKELENILRINDLPKVDSMLADIFRILSKREKNVEFTPHTLKDLVEQLSKYNTNDTGKPLPQLAEKYTQQIESIITFLDNLKVDQITTPLRSVSEFIEGDLRATDPKFLGMVTTTLQNLDFENRKVTNSAVSPRGAWMKFALIAMIIVMIVVAVYWMYDQGYFDSLTTIGEGFQGISFPAPGIPQGPGVKDDKYYQDNYTPESLKAAVDRGEIDPNDLPPATANMIKNVQVPTAEPTP